VGAVADGRRTAHAAPLRQARRAPPPRGRRAGPRPARTRHAKALKCCGPLRRLTPRPESDAGGLPLSLPRSPDTSGAGSGAGCGGLSRVSNSTGAEHPGAGMPSFGLFQHSVHSKIALASSFLLSMSCGREAPAASLPRTIPSWNCRSIIRRRSPLPGARYHPWRRTALASVSSVTEAQHERHRDQRGSYDNRRGYGRPRHRDCLVQVAALPGAAAASARATKLSPDPSAC
jgi:hypothetical protein